MGGLDELSLLRMFLRIHPNDRHLPARVRAFLDFAIQHTDTELTRGTP